MTELFVPGQVWLRQWYDGHWISCEVVEMIDTGDALPSYRTIWRSNRGVGPDLADQEERIYTRLDLSNSLATYVLQLDGPGRMLLSVTDAMDVFAALKEEMVASLGVG